MEPDQSHLGLCHPSPRIINIRLLQHISCMCLPGGSSVRLTNAASKHAPGAALKCWPMWFTLDGGGAGRTTGPGNVYIGRFHVGDRISLLPVAEESFFLHCFACLVGVGELQRRNKNVFFPYLFICFLKSMSSHPIPGKTTGLPPTPSQQSPRPSVLKNTHLLCCFLLLWICFEQQLISV